MSPRGLFAHGARPSELKKGAWVMMIMTVMMLMMQEDPQTGVYALMSNQAHLAHFAVRDPQIYPIRNLLPRPHLMPYIGEPTPILGGFALEYVYHDGE
jgi:hypothetical protein